MTQYLIIAAIVLWAVLYSAWALMPAALRQAVATHVAGWARRCGLGDRGAEKLRAELARPSACGACSSCPGCAKPAAATNPTRVERDSTIG